MGFSGSFNKLKKVIGVATVLATLSCLAPEFAQAGILKFSGSPNSGETTLNFTLNDEAIKIKIAEEIFIFKEAVQDAKYICSDEVKKTLCAGKPEIDFQPSDLKASRIINEIDPDFPNLPLPGEDLVGGVKYEATLYDEDNNFLKFAFFVKPGNPDDELSSLGIFSSFRGVATEEVNTMNFIDLTDDFKIVPEPNATNSLLGIGALGTVLLLKRTRRSGKFQESQNSAVETQEVV